MHSHLEHLRAPHLLTGGSCATPRNTEGGLVRSQMSLGFSLFEEIVAVPCGHSLWHPPYMLNCEFRKESLDPLNTDGEKKNRKNSSPSHDPGTPRPAPSQTSLSTQGITSSCPVLEEKQQLCGEWAKEQINNNSKTINSKSPERLRLRFTVKRL